MHAGIRYFGRTGTLTINSLLLNCASRDIADLTPLWMEYSTEGDDARPPGVDGVVPFQRFMSAQTFPLALLISGDVDEDGTPYANAWIGLETETNLVKTALGIHAPSHAVDGTLAATLVKPSGAIFAAAVHVLGFRVGASVGQGAATTPTTPAGPHALMRAVLQISVPAGAFVDTGS